jgi:hypothetical protein
MRWFLLAAAGIVSYQIFVPPVVGLANQQDFKRVIGKFGYGPEPPEAPVASISLKYIRDPSYRVKSWEQRSTEDLFVKLALWVNRVVSKDGKLDIRVMGLLHAAVFLAALAWLLHVTQSLPARPFIWTALVLVTTDVAYVSYFNAFYAEASSYVFCLLLLADSIDICKRGVSATGLIRWSAWAVLLVLAKPINAALGVLLGLFILRLAWRSWTAWIGSAAILSAVVFSVVTTPPDLTDANTYNLVFLCLLPESNSPAADAVALGFEPGTDVFARTGAWSENTGYYYLWSKGAIPNKVNLATVTRFFLTHPTRLWRHVRVNLGVAAQLRPDLGNFDKSQPPAAKSQAFALWSGFHAAVVRRAARLLFFLLLLPPFAAVCWRLTGGACPLYFEFLAVQTSCCVLSFLAASFGDGWDTVRHLFLFNFLLDTCLISAVALGWLALGDAAGRVRAAFRRAE